MRPMKDGDLVPGSLAWKRCRDDLMLLILGQKDRHQGRREYVLPTSTAGYLDLNSTVRWYAQGRLGAGTDWTDSNTWHLLCTVVDAVADNDYEQRGLWGAKVLLARLEEPDDRQPIPRDPDHRTLEGLRSEGGIAARAGFATSVTVRKAYMLGVFGGTDIGIFKDDKPSTRRIADDTLAAMLAEIDRRAALEPATAELAASAQAAPVTGR